MPRQARGAVDNPLVGGAKRPYDSSMLRRNRWAFAKRDSILSWDPHSPMPAFKELCENDEIEWLDLSETEILEGKRLKNYVIVSHRWFHRDHPDWDPVDAQNQGAKLRELQKYLEANPDVQGVDGLDVRAGGQRDARAGLLRQNAREHQDALPVRQGSHLPGPSTWAGSGRSTRRTFRCTMAPRKGKPKTVEEVDGDIVFIEMGAAASVER